MTRLSDLPFDIVGEIVDNLQDDLAALKSGAQTCLSLLLLCRKYIFRTITLGPRCRSIRSFASLLDTNPRIVDYVQNLVYVQPTCMNDLDCFVPPILDKFHRIHYFELSGNIYMNWSELGPRLRESLSRIIHSATQLNICSIANFPISIFIPCINLIELTLYFKEPIVDDMNSYEHEYFDHDALPQLQSLILNRSAVTYRGHDTAVTIVDARCSEHIPVLDLSNLRTLSVHILDEEDLKAIHAVTKVTKKLETLSYEYSVDHGGFKDLTASMNPSSFSTLRLLHFCVRVGHYIQDPLSGVCDELDAISGRSNVIEELELDILCNRCKNPDRLGGRLDDVLATGFPRLGRVSLHVWIRTDSDNGDSIVLDEFQFPWLSNNSIVKFDLSVKLV